MLASLAHLASALVCPVGQFCLGPVASASSCLGQCVPIAPGYYADPLQAIEVPCPAGKFCVGGVLAPCPMGTFQPLAGQSACQACAPGTYNPGAGLSTPCSPCTPGSYNPGILAAGNATSDLMARYAAVSCASCPPGTYTHLPGQAQCLPCPPGTANAQYGQRDAARCLPCTQTPATTAGWFCAAGAAGPLPCPAGGFCPTVTQFIACPPGTVNALPAQSTAAACGACPAGSIAPRAGSVRCLASTCPANTYA